MKKVILSRRAYLSMLAEVYERIETETGGIFLGHREGDTWYVLESVEPGPKSIFTPTYFEYDDAYVTYRANKLRRLYKCSIELLGLWHRHPSLMKTFSSTDDGTNKIYSDMLGGAVSGIVTLGNGFEITMYYVPSNVQYQKIEWVVDDNLIPPDYLAYYDTEYYKNLINETVEKSHFNVRRRVAPDMPDEGREDPPKGYTKPQTPRRKSIVASALDKVADSLNYVIDYMTGYYDQEEEENPVENSEVAIIFDTIEAEIAYLQKLQTDGRIEWNMSTVKNNKGQEGLFLEIEDLRQEEKLGYKLIFFLGKNGVMVKYENGSVRPYTERVIATILGG